MKYKEDNIKPKPLKTKFKESNGQTDTNGIHKNRLKN